MNKTNDKKLILYHFESCPYCRFVRSFLEKEGIEIEQKDILKDPKAAEELIEVGGKRQVPCLFIDGQPLYESMDIVAWFKDNIVPA